MNKYETYFGQVITDDELNEIFNSFSTAIEQLIQEFGYTGIAIGGDVAQNPTPNLQVTVSGPTVVYDQAGNRVSWGSPVTVDCSVDENNQSTAVLGSGNEKWVSVFVKFVSTPSDPRVDDVGDTVYFRKVAGYRFHVVQGPEAAVGVAPRAALRGDEILLADIKLSYAQATITTANVNNSRSQVVYNLPGTPLSIRAKNVKDVMTQMVAQLNALDISGYQLPAIGGSPLSVPSGTLLSGLTTIVNAFNTFRSSVDTGTLPAKNAGDINNPQQWTGYNQFNGALFTATIRSLVTSVMEPLLSSENPPTDTEKWKLIFAFRRRSAGGQRIRIYVGADGGKVYGGFCIAFNAYWVAPGVTDGDTGQPSTGYWKSSDTSKDASALIMLYNRIRISTRPADAGPPATSTWAEWPGSEEGDLPIGASVDGLGLQVVGGLTVNKSARISNQLNVNAQSVTPSATPATDNASQNLALVVGGDASVAKLWSTSLSSVGSATIRNNLNVGDITVALGSVTVQQGDVVTQNGHDIRADNALKGKSLIVTPNASSVAALTVNGDLTLNEDLKISNVRGIKYATDKYRTDEVNIATAQSMLGWTWAIGGADVGSGADNYSWGAAGGSTNILLVPIVFPHNTKIDSIEVLNYQAGTNPIQMYLHRLATRSENDPGQPAASDVIGLTTLASRAAGFYWDGVYIADADDKEYSQLNTYMLRIVVTPPSASQNYVFRIKRGWYARGIE